MPRTLRDDDIKVLAPLAALIEKIVRTTPIRMVPGGTDNLTAQLTVQTCVWVGRHVLPATRSLAAFVAAVDDERQAQLSRWGDQRHPDGTGSPEQGLEVAVARQACQEAFDRGTGTWRHVLLEEVFEALGERDPGRLRTELVQVAAVCAAWIHDIDTRPPAESPGGTT